jgi:hypothetical protein
MRYRDTLTISSRSGRRSLALGAVMMLGSAMTVLATGNTPPTNLTLTASPATINEGDTITLTGSFTDPDVTDYHTLRIKWRDTNAVQKVQLAPGVTTFQATHTYTVSGEHGVPYEWKPTVEVWDRQSPGEQSPNDNMGLGGEDFAWATFTINNVAPTFAHNVTAHALHGTPYTLVAEGDIVDPGTSDPVEVYAKWDGAPNGKLGLGEPCTMTNATRHFRCERSYAVQPGPTSKPKSVTLTARDDDGGQTTVTKAIQFP